MAKKLTPFNLPIPGWDERPMTSDDFKAACEREVITIKRQRLPEDVSGVFCRGEDGTPYIYIDTKLRGRDKVRVEFHELGHYFLHSHRKGLLRIVGVDFDYTPEQEWVETEANAVAFVALAPGFRLKDFLQIASLSAAKHNWSRAARRAKRKVQQ